jgi:hypothetical protein
MDTAYKHQLKIARDTIKMNPALLGIVGGMTLPEAEAFLAAHEEKMRQRRNAASRARHDAYRSLGMKRTPYGYE